MAILSKISRNQAIGILVKRINNIAAYFNVHRQTIGRLASRHRATASVEDRVGSGRPLEIEKDNT